MARPVVLLVDDGCGEHAAARQVLWVALARCRACKGRFRVLPADVLPHKHYGMAVIVSLTTAHVEVNKSLRMAAWTTHTGQTPSHTTLHAWSEGLGAFVLGRPFGSLHDAHPFQAIVATTTARWSALEKTPIAQPSVDPRRHRSEARRDRLLAVASLLTMASAVIEVADLDIHLAEDSPPLCAWRQLSIHAGVPAPFAFRTGITCTPFEHGVGADRDSSGSFQPTGDSTCQIRTRSPPSASSRSLPSSIPPSIPANDGT